MELVSESVMIYEIASIRAYSRISMKQQQKETEERKK